jgi:2-hydroxychromene-2-carboxylate isomerase
MLTRLSMWLGLITGYIDKKAILMAHITYFFATISPFTYLAGTRMEVVAQKHVATVEYRPMDLMTVFGRTGGVPPKDRHISRIEMRSQELRREANKLHMPMNFKPAFFPVNMAPSSYAFISAGRYGDGDLGGLAHGFTRAVWEEEKDISQPDVIADCLKAAGFDPNLADKDMIGSAEQYTKNTEDAIAAGVFGSPFYITDTDQRLWGQDRIENLDLVLSDAL